MSAHGYNTRSKDHNSTAEPGASGTPSNAVIRSPQTFGFKLPIRQKETKKPKLQATSLVPMPNAPEPAGEAPAEEVPRLFTLPDELQTMIYEYVVIEPEWLLIGIRMVSQTKEMVLWQIDTIKYPQMRLKEEKPTLLSVCKYLRSFATPIYFAGNTFMLAAMDCSPRGVEALWKTWGKDVKRIRNIDYSLYLTVAYICPRKGHQTEFVELWIEMKLQERGKLKLSLRSYGSDFGWLESGKVCQCELDRFATTLQHQGNDNRRLFEIIAHYKQYDCELFSWERCPHCGLPQLTDTKLYDPNQPQVEL